MNLDLVKSLGAEEVVDYTREDFTTGAVRYHAIIDAVGRRKSATALLRANEVLDAGGKLISIDDDFPKIRAEDLLLLQRLSESGQFQPASIAVIRWRRWPPRTATSSRGTNAAM